MGRIRILNIITRLEQGGAPLSVLEMIGRLSSSRYDVVLAAGQTDDPDLDLTEAARNRGLQLCVIPALRRTIHPLRDLLAFCQIVRAIRAGRYHLIHTHTSKAGLLGRLAARFCGIAAVVHSPHGTVLEGYFGPLTTRFFALLERLAALWADRIICLTEMEIGQYLRVRIGRRSQYTHIYNGIDVEAFAGRASDRTALRTALGLAADHLVCITVGRLVPVKGHADLLHAFRMAVTACPQLRLVIVGEGLLRPQLEDLSANLGLDQRVMFLGWRNDTAELLGASDIFILSSHNEGLGLVLVEAMARCLPVVATAVGGVPEVVRHNRTGILVAPCAPEAMARAIQALAADVERRRRMGRAGYERARAHFSIDDTVRRTEQLYRTLIGTRP